MAYQQNAQVFVELEALVEKLGYGTLDISLDIDRRQIRATTYYGKKRFRYDKNNHQAMQDIADRLIAAISQEKTEQVTFVINVRAGNIEQTIFQSEQKKSHEKVT